ncbi:MAG: PAS domain S-box protein [Bacteroidetes bacterium]|nr:PAS domain S-box protein [Bacteroidota bacterium]
MDVLNSLVPNILALSLIFPATLSTILVIEALKPRYAPRGKNFALLMLSIAIWSAAYGLELASTDMADMLFWLKVEYLGIPFVSVLMLFVIQQFAALDQVSDKKRSLYLLIIPLITLILSLTNEYHHLYYSGIGVQPDGNMSRLVLDFGPWYYVHVCYAYGIIIYALFVLVRKIFYNRSLFRKQLLFLLFAVLIPALVFTVYFLGLMPIENLDPTPFAFALSGLAMSVSILRFRMLDLMPIAREHIFQSMGDGLIVFDKKHRLVDCNPIALKMFGWEHVPFGESIDTVWVNFPQMIALFDETTVNNIEVIDHSRQEEKCYLTSVSEILDHKQGVVGHLLIIHDITQRHLLQEKVRHNEEKLRLLNAEKDKLFSIIGHDLRGPIGSFIGLTEMFMDDTYEVTPEEMKSIASTMNQSAKTLQNLLENLLEWAKMQREEVQVIKVNVALAEVFDRAFRLLSEMAQEKELTTENRIPAGFSVCFDQNMLFTIARNLLSNALKFTPKGGLVFVDLQSDAGQIVFRVCDNGIGMPPGMLDKLFMFDESIGRPGTEGEASSGLGLKLCKEFVERNGGQLLVNSEVNKGTCFSIVLP